MIDNKNNIVFITIIFNVTGVRDVNNKGNKNVGVNQSFRSG